MPNFKYATALLLISFCFLSSCELINPDEQIPSYVKIDSVNVTTDITTQGTAKHNIFDAWVVHNGLVVATVPIPCTVPVLQDKGNIVSILPGIKESGTSTNRSIYPFFDAVDVEIGFNNDGAIYDFNQDDIVFKYKDNVKFLWLEDFESETVSIQEINQDSAPFSRTKSPNNVFEGEASFQIKLTQTDTIMSVQGFNYFSGSEFNIGSPTFLEMHYKNDINMQVGFAYKSPEGVVQYDQPHLYLRESSEWKKVYINMTDLVALLNDEAGIRVYFAAIIPTDKSEAEILLDNIKLLTFE
ncbi:MAG: hypothetical protein JXQ87_13340 [Bacteroidia bacterium]